MDCSGSIGVVTGLWAGKSGPGFCSREETSCSVRFEVAMAVAVTIRRAESWKQAVAKSWVKIKCGKLPSAFRTQKCLNVVRHRAVW